ncbi:MarR family winged helix-turn-helix transcriptional regulator [Mycoplasma todarodis]|uniref:HTH marR-type domain-containing protein n=1 Tax=Mycoplasma todarodis TaxID=1937191 RepID=A0A4R0XTI3_9MOLU|nr:MarR family transcriptional regulator [Mycoplasma todarodis]TCG11804.1 hypothetical protein C4B25_00580 [Mycoplasma todarodis]
MNAQETKQISNALLIFETKIQKVQLRELKKQGLNISHRELIYIVFIKNNEGKRMLEIGKEMGLSKGAFSNTVKTLVEKKLVRKERMEDDKRVIILTLDEKGEEAYKIHGEARRKITNSLTKLLSKEEQEWFVAVTSRLLSEWTRNNAFFYFKISLILLYAKIITVISFILKLYIEEEEWKTCQQKRRCR